ncbi:MAG: Uma2 family endonuclease [Caulobacterales bacterium]|nr:Uma2 family endonuclease [Caulobacterales bacterium]
MGDPISIAPELTERPLTAGDFLTLIESGAFARDARRIELIDGRLIIGPHDGADHSSSGGDVLAALAPLLQADPDLDRMWLAVSNPAVRLDDTRVVQPGIAIVRRDIRGTVKLFTPDHIALAVEIADSSLAYDDGEKKRLYAEGGLAELWIVRLGPGDVRVCSAPKDGVWTAEALLKPGDVIRPGFAQGAEAAVAGLLGEA